MTQEKNIAIAEMLGWKYNKDLDKWIVDYNNSIFNHESSAFKVNTLKFHSDANWQYEAIDWIEKQGYLLNLTVDYIGHNEYKNRIPSYWIDITYYPLDEMGKTVNDLEPVTIYDQTDYSKNRKEAVFEALYQFSQYIKSKV